MSAGLVIRILRLVVVLPIALALVLLLPIWELIGFAACDGHQTWAAVAQGCIERIARFVWP